MKTNVIDILSKELVGKKITLLKYHFQYNTKAPVEIRLKFDNPETRLSEKTDQKIKLVGPVMVEIIKVHGDHDKWEGEYLYIRVKHEDHQEDINLNVDDVLDITE